MSGLLVLALLLPLFFATFFMAPIAWAATEENPDNLDIKVTTTYGIIIDAGSGGSRLHVFNWAPRVFSTLPPPITFPTDNEAWTARMGPGVATFTTLEGVRGHLAPLIDFAVATLIDQTYELGDIPIFFKATGGMRELPVNQRELIVSYVRQLLLDKTFSPFFFHYEMARIISGEEEAIFSWACVNYLFGTLLPNPDTRSNFDMYFNNGAAGSPRISDNGTFGTVDLGGASTQIAFFVETQDISEGLFKFQLGSSKHWNVYTKSFLQFGHQSARVRHVTGLANAAVDNESQSSAGAGEGGTGVVDPERKGPKVINKVGSNVTVVDPCFYSGYSEQVSITTAPNTPGGTVYVTLEGGEEVHKDAFERCKDAVRPLLVKYTNSYCEVVYNGQCSINGAYQPSVTADTNGEIPGVARHFIGTSSYMFPWEILLLNTTATLDDYEKQAKVVCAMTYAQVVQYSVAHNLAQTDKYLGTIMQDYCFMVSYVYLLLTEGYGFPRNQTFTVLDVINGNTVGWAFGAMMYEINTMPWKYQPKDETWLSSATFLLAGAVLGLVVAVMVSRYYVKRHDHEQGGHTYSLLHFPTGGIEMSNHQGTDSTPNSGRTGEWGTRISQHNPFNNNKGGSTGSGSGDPITPVGSGIGKGGSSKPGVGGGGYQSLEEAR